MQTTSEYRLMRALADNGEPLAAAAAAGTVAIGLMLGVRGVVPVAGMVGIGLGVGLITKNLSEINKVVSETLLPQ